MTRFTVVWHQEAEDELARIWLESTHRQAVTTAANTIDRQLADDPDALETYLLAGLRLYAQLPLRAIYRVREEDRLVSVLYIESLE